jgi:hypothetical protein
MDENVHLSDKAMSSEESGAKLLGDMESAIRNKLLDMSYEFGGEFSKAMAAYIDMPDELKAHPMYKQLGQRLDAVEALLNTLNHTAATFPVPVDEPNGTTVGTGASGPTPAPHVPHGAL